MAMLTPELLVVVSGALVLALVAMQTEAMTMESMVAAPAEMAAAMMEAPWVLAGEMVMMHGLASSPAPGGAPPSSHQPRSPAPG